MIASCPKCEARYRVDEGRIGEGGARLKCAKCQAVFRVVPPVLSPEPVVMATPVEPAPVATQPLARPPQQAAPSAPAVQVAAPQAAPSQSGVVDRDRLILVADPNEESGKRTAQALTEWGLQPVVVHDGVEAMLTIQRMLPRVVVLDAALPKMYGFQVCEIVKRNDSLRDIRVVLIGAIHNRDRYHRPPTDLYGADTYLEHPDLPDGLIEIIRQVGITIPYPGPQASPPPAASPAMPPAPQPAAIPQASPATLPAPQAAAPVFEAPVANAVAMPVEEISPQETSAPLATPAADDGFAEERSKAERLARIVVSDIVLYQPDKFAAALTQGSVVEAMDSEIQEGRALFRQRVHESVREEKDYIVEELLRVARERGMQ